MMQDIPHQWLYPQNLEEAAAVQRLLAERVSLQDDSTPVETLAGVDVSNNLRDPDNMIYAAVVTLNFPFLKVTDKAGMDQQAQFPYIPGFLGFREAPAIVEAFQKLAHPPDLILVDGHGISHPRRLGIASHLGVLLDRPTIGVAKSVLVGKPSGELGPEPGDSVPLLWKGQQIGMVLRTKRRANPLYISPGHKISLPTAIDWVLKCLTGYRLPEPTRQAHLAANEFRRQAQPVSGLF